MYISIFHRTTNNKVLFQNVCRVKFNIFTASHKYEMYFDQTHPKMSSNYDSNILIYAIFFMYLIEKPNNEKQDYE